MTHTPLLWIGPYGDRGGYAQASRTYIQAAVAAGVEIATRPLTFDASSAPGQAHVDDLLWDLQRPLPRPATVAVHCTPDNWPRLLHDFPNSTRRVGVTVWETDCAPPRWARAIHEAAIDDLWLPNEFNVRAFSRAFERADLRPPRFSILPHAHDIAYMDGVDAPPVRIDGVDPDDFVFLSAGTWLPRKGFDVLIPAYLRAFDATDPVALLVKAYVIGRDPEASRQELERALANLVRSCGVARPPKIILLSQLLDPVSLLGVYRRADVGVFPARGEGWGLHTTEMMLCSRPCIATGWSAFVEYIEDAVSGWLIDYDLTPVVGMPSHYDVKQSWAQPRVLHLAELMRRCFEQRAPATGVAARAAIERYGLAEVGATMRGLL